MAENKRFRVPYRRKRAGLTDYRKRLTLLKSGMDRLVIRKTGKNCIAQIVRYEATGDKVLVTTQAIELKKHGWKGPLGNIPAAYLTGVLLGKKAKAQKIKKAVLDTGLYVSVKGSRIYACLKGVIDAGVEVPCDTSILPTDERVSGKHIDTYRKKAKGHQFSKTAQDLNIEKEFAATKQKILA